MSRRITCDGCKAEIPSELERVCTVRVLVTHAGASSDLHRADYDLCQDCQRRLTRRIPPWLWNDKDDQ